MKFRIAAASCAAAGVLALSAPVHAAEGDVDVSAWLKANKETVELFLGVDVDTCKGVDGLTYDQSLRLADAEGIDLKELAERTDPEAIMEYVNDAGITLADIDRFLDRFCAGEVVVPPPSTPGDGSASPTDGSTAPGDSSTPPDGSGDPTDGSTPPQDGSSAAPGATESPKAGDDAKDGSMADTGAASPLLPIGIGAASLGFGGAAVYFARRRGIL
jgi:hypothetical protein